ncbi:hypothetical protein ES703_23107 [subsurface metagenome]
MEIVIFILCSVMQISLHILGRFVNPPKVLFKKNFENKNPRVRAAAAEPATRWLCGILARDPGFRGETYDAPGSKSGRFPAMACMVLGGNSVDKRSVV